MQIMHLLLDGLTQSITLVHCYCYDAAEADSCVLHNVQLERSTMQDICASQDCH